jgi:hypothetical protein
MSNCACRGRLKSSVTDSIIRAKCTAYCLSELDQHNQGASLYLPTDFVNTLFVTFITLEKGCNDHGLASYEHICDSFSMNFKQTLSISLIRYGKRKFAYSKLASKHYE